MPVYDSVLGAHLAVGDAEIFELAASNDQDLSASDREAQLAALVDASCELALESEDGERKLVAIVDGERRDHVMVDSRVTDRVEPPKGARNPPLVLRRGVAIDDLLDVLRDHDVDDALELPYHWHSRDELLATLARAASLIRKLRAVVEIDNRRHEIELATSVVTCRALHTLSDDPRAAARFVALAQIATGDDIATAPVVAAVRTRPSKLDPTRPLTTGSAAQRLRAWHGTTSEVASAIAAVQDVANQEPRYVELRREIYRHLAKLDTPAVRELFLWALANEDDDTVATVIWTGWRLESLLAELPARIRTADPRTAARMTKLLVELG